MKVLVTGANGFLGNALMRRLCGDSGWQPRAAARRFQASAIDLPCERVTVQDIDGTTSWATAVAGCEAVVHTAARVHVMREDSAETLAQYRLVNVQGTLNLAQQARAAGVRRFVFISSIKVNGEQTAPGTAFRAEDLPRPQDSYGISKLEAEQALQKFSQKTGMEVVILRPPLIYGPGVRANFAALMRVVARGIPLPLGGIDNRRSLLALDNAVDVITTCLRHPQAAGGIFLASDGEDVSTRDLVRRIAQAMHTRPRLVDVPPALLRATARLLGKGDAVQRLCENLQVDTRATVATLGWRPPISLDEGLRLATATLRKVP